MSRVQVHLLQNEAFNCCVWVPDGNPLSTVRGNEWVRGIHFLVSEHLGLTSEVKEKFWHLFDTRGGLRLRHFNLVDRNSLKMIFYLFSSIFDKRSSEILLVCVSFYVCLCEMWKEHLLVDVLTDSQTIRPMLTQKTAKYVNFIQELLAKMSAPRFPWRRLLLLVFVAVASLIAYDVYRAGAFKRKYEFIYLEKAAFKHEVFDMSSRVCIYR